MVLIHSPREPAPPSSNVYNGYIRRIDNLFVAGKMEPIVRMFNPEDSNYVTMKRALEDYLLQHYFQKCTSLDVIPHVVVNKLSIEQLCKLFPYLRSEEHQRDFNERYRQFLDIQNRTSEYSCYSDV